MDRLKRITRLDEWRLGGRYFWMKDTFIRGPFICCEIRNDERSVVLREQNAEYGHVSFNWESRYISAADLSAKAVLFKDTLGERQSTKVLDWRLSALLKARRVRMPGQSCGKCEFFDPMMELCRNDKNARQFGVQMATDERGWCQWYSRRVRQ